MNTRNIKPLVGAVYNPATRLLKGYATVNMAPDYSMPETPANSRPAPQIIDQVIPGITTTLPTPNNPTVVNISNPAVMTATDTKPWYQWFVDHPLYTAGIGIAGVGVIYLLTRKSKRK